MRHTDVATTYAEGEEGPQAIRDDDSAREVSGLTFHNGRHQSRTDTGRRTDKGSRGIRTVADGNADEGGQGERGDRQYM